MNPRVRSCIYALCAIVLVWVIAIGGSAVFKNAKMTALKVKDYVEGTDFSKLSGEARAKALRELAAKINALSPEERQKARLAHLWDRWFVQMNEDEKGEFVEATLPSGFKQMITSFEQMTAERRQRAVENAVKRMRETRDNMADGTRSFASIQGTNSPSGDTNAPPVMSEDMQKRVAMIGLRSVYTSGSAQTKAELAPLLEELQHNLESGRLFRGGR